MIEVHLPSALLSLSALPTYISCTYEQNSKKHDCTENEETAKRLVFLKKWKISRALQAFLKYAYKFTLYPLGT